MQLVLSLTQLWMNEWIMDYQPENQAEYLDQIFIAFSNKMKAYGTKCKNNVTF